MPPVFRYEGAAARRPFVVVRHRVGIAFDVGLVGELAPLPRRPQTATATPVPPTGGCVTNMWATRSAWSNGLTV